MNTNDGGINKEAILAKRIESLFLSQNLSKSPQVVHIPEEHPIVFVDGYANTWRLNNKRAAWVLKWLTATNSVDKSVVHAECCEEWKGEAYYTFHEYGVQMHRTRDEADRWNALRRILHSK